MEVGLNEVTQVIAHSLAQLARDELKLTEILKLEDIQHLCKGEWAIGLKQGLPELETHVVNDRCASKEAPTVPCDHTVDIDCNTKSKCRQA